MKKFFINYFIKFRKTNIIKKILSIFVILIYIFIVCICTIKVDYTILTPGVANKVSSFIKVDSENENGNIYTVAVFSDTKIPLIRYWLAKNDDRFDLYKKTNPISEKDEFIQGQISKDISITNAIINAYSVASLYDPSVTIDYEFLGATIYSIDKNSDKSLYLGDKIIKVEGEELTSFPEFIEKINLFLSNTTKDTIELTILRNEEEITINPNLIIENDKKRIGITTYATYKILSTTPSFTVESNDTGGPSGGLMQTIAVYNAITSKDITNGKIILGTGEIDLNGNVGAIGGIKQKIQTADLYNDVSVFFSPWYNYNDAYEQWSKLKKPSFVVVPVATFKDAIEYLNNPNPDDYLVKVGE